MKKKIIQTLINEKWLHIIIGGIIINALCFLMYFVTSAESSPDKLPYIVANENISGYDDFVNGLRYNGGYSWAVNNIDNDNFFGYDYWESGYKKFCFYFPAEDFEYSFVLSDEYNDFDITQDTCQMTIKNYTYISGRIEGYNGRYYFYGASGYNKVTTETTITFFQNSSNGNGYALVPNISSQNYIYDNNQYQVVFGFGNPTPPVIPNGHATPPEELDSPIYTQGHARPESVPTAPQINNYSWTTHTNPTIDTTNLETLTKSLIDIVVYNFNYLFTNLAGLFNNLISNIVALISYIGQVIEYYGNLIISNLQNLITTFYNNMVSLGESISQTLTAIHDLLTNPLDTALLNTQLNNSSFVGAIRTTESQITSFFGIFSDISQPDNIIFEIDLRDLWFNGGIAYLDFSIISPILPFIRLVLGCILLYSLIVTIVTNINSYIGGNGAKNDSEG